MTDVSIDQKLNDTCLCSKQTRQVTTFNCRSLLRQGVQFHPCCVCVCTSFKSRSTIGALRFARKWPPFEAGNEQRRWFPGHQGCIDDSRRIKSTRVPWGTWWILLSCRSFPYIVLPFTSTALDSTRSLIGTLDNVERNPSWSSRVLLQFK